MIKKKMALARDMDEKKREEMDGAADETENKTTRIHKHTHLRYDWFITV